jgi:hypothetical protein
LVDVEQQPPLHACDEPQAVVQVPADVHASLAGQSAAVVQPQVPLTRHTLPAALPVQLVQAPPAALQAVFEMASHVLLEPQQNPEPHVPVDVPTVQDDVQAPPEQVGVPPPHAAQAPPVPPQSLSLVPGVHCEVVVSQQPPLQAVCETPQAASHTPVVVLHDWPAAQSVASVHPEAPVSPAPVSVPAPASVPVSSAVPESLPVSSAVPASAPASCAVPASLPVSSATPVSVAMPPSPPSSPAVESTDVSSPAEPSEPSEPPESDSVASLPAASCPAESLPPEPSSAPIASPPSGWVLEPVELLLPQPPVVTAQPASAAQTPNRTHRPRQSVIRTPSSIGTSHSVPSARSGQTGARRFFAPND